MELLLKKENSRLFEITSCGHNQSSTAGLACSRFSLRVSTPASAETGLFGVEKRAVSLQVVRRCVALNVRFYPRSRSDQRVGQAAASEVDSLLANGRIT